MRDKDLEDGQLLIPKSLYDELVSATSDDEAKEIADRILQSQQFQMLNDYPIPPEFCLHLRRIVYPDIDAQGQYKSYQCINCKKYL